MLVGLSGLSHQDGSERECGGGNTTYKLGRFDVRQLKATPNPFTSFATLPGHEAERFSLYDISGRRVGIFRGDRVGEGLAPGVYFLKHQEMLKQVQHDEIVRIVKVR